MPNHDGTGPKGKGPLTGWGMGDCVLQLNNAEQEHDYLVSQAQLLQLQLNKTRARIKALERKVTVNK